MAAGADSECNTVTLAKDGLINLERPFPLSRSTSQTSRTYGPLNSDLPQGLHSHRASLRKHVS